MRERLDLEEGGMGNKINKQQMTNHETEKKKLADKIIEKELKPPKIKAIYLPNFKPKNKVKYIFVAMEPSFGWIKSLAKEDIERAEKDVIKKDNFYNFLYSVEDFIVHWCIREYLKPDSYHLTDVSPIAMKVKDANRPGLRKEIYKKMEQFLKNEIKIYGKKDCKIFCFGKKSVEFVKHPIYLLHYSPNAAKHRKTKVDEIGNDKFEKFKEPKGQEIYKTAEGIIEEYGVTGATKDKILEKLEKSLCSKDLGESRKRLIFIYKTEFQKKK